MAISEKTQEWMDKENERRAKEHERIAELDKRREEREKYPRISDEEIIGFTICKNKSCKNKWYVIRDDNGELIPTGRRKFKETHCTCGQSLEFSKAEVDRITAKKFLMYMPPTHHTAPYEQDELSFQPFTAQAVSDRVWKKYRHIRQFVDIRDIKWDPIDYPPTSNEVLLANFSGDRIETPL